MLIFLHSRITLKMGLYSKALVIKRSEIVNLLQVAKKTAQKSKTIWTDIERWQKVQYFDFLRLLSVMKCFFHLFHFRIHLYVLIFSFLVHFQGVASTDGKITKH